MSKTYYELLDLPSTATLEDIKRNFRREIAKYHPDKVQHLGTEFQDIAAVKAAELTQAYKTLSDDVLRGEYDELLQSGDATSAPARAAAPASAPAAEQPEPQAPRPQTARPAEPHVPPSPGQGSVFQQDRAASSDLILKAATMRFKTILLSEFGNCDIDQIPGFDVACIPKPAFWKLKLPPRVVGKFVGTVDAAAVVEAWGNASRMKKDTQRDLLVFVMGPAVAPASELAAAITDQRRKPMPAGGKLTLIPVNTRNWNAHVPNDAPPVVKALLTRLKTA